MNISQLKREVFLSIAFPEGIDTLMVRIESDRNKEFYNIYTPSPNAPQGWALHSADEQGELWLPTVDVKITSKMNGRVHFSSTEEVTFYMNGYYNTKPHVSENGCAILSAVEMTPWENGLYVLSKTIKPTAFYVEFPVARIPTITTVVETSIELLTEDFSGTAIAYYEKDGKEIVVDQGVIACRNSRKMQSHYPEDKVKAALENTLRFVMSSVIENSSAPQNKGMYLFYDLDSKCYRQHTWPWGWGPSIKLLLDAASSGMNFLDFSPEILADTAHRVGLTTLRLQVQNEKHIMNGAGTTRWSMRDHWTNASTAQDRGYLELVNGASDSGFLAGWGWMPIYNYLNDDKFVVASEKLAKNIQQQLDNYIVPPQEYLAATEYLSNITIDESGFGAIGLSELYLATGEQKYADLCKLYMDRHLEIFDSENGLWHRKYNHDQKKMVMTKDDMLVTRGQGWAMIGLLAAHDCCEPMNKYIKRAIVLSDEIIAKQNADGSFYFRLDEGDSYRGIGEKAVSLWCLMLYKMYRATKYPRYLVAARKALNWCIRHQYLGEDQEAFGCVPGNSEVGAVGYREYFNLACQYTSGFFGLALLEELKVR
ncbi:MAG: glycoside hydrolase family 88 protein [Faecalibacterium sp.]